jgi:hypothetical protein
MVGPPISLYKVLSFTKYIIKAFSWLAKYGALKALEGCMGNEYFGYLWTSW